MLVEREGELSALRGMLDAAIQGHGALVFIGGEAGIGKTSLVHEVMDMAAGRVAIRRGYADNIATADALGALSDAVPEIVESLGASATRIRILRQMTAVLGAEPTLLVLEDVHWADEASLDLLRYVGRRIADLPLLVLATHRDDEVPARHPLSIVMGELAALPAVSRLQVRPLTVDGVRELVDESGADVDPQRLHARTAGNAFFVTELLTSSTDETTLPETVRDAVLARTAGMSTAARRVVDAAAVLRRTTSVPLLTAVAGSPSAAVDECVASGVLVTSSDGVAFRHDLARLSVEDAIPPGERAELHAAALRELTLIDPSEHRALAHHAAACGNWPAVLVHAPAAASRAARLGAHRQAVEHYRMALRTPSVAPEQRAHLFEQLSFECYLTELTEEALVARRQAMELFELIGDVESVGRAQRWLSRLSWFLGRNADAERYAERAISTLQGVGSGHELAMAYSNMSQLRALGHDCTAAVSWGERALAMAREIGDREVQMHALNNVGTAMRMVGQSVQGRQQLNRSLELALADDAHEHAARAYTNLGFSMYVSRELGSSEQVLRAGIVYCEERDLDSWTRYMSATLVAVLTEQGRYDDAIAIADPLLAHPQLAPISRIPAAVARSRIEVYRGSGLGEAFDTVEQTARTTGEGQRLIPVAAARAEAAWIEGRTDAIEAAVDIAWDVAVRHPEGWELGELAWWLDRAGIRRELPVAAAEPFTLMLSGRWQDAAAQWQSLGCPLWAALSLANDPSLDAGRTAADTALSLGATAVHAAIVRTRHAAGLPVPRGPRATTRSNGAHLTARELDVLRLVSDGLSNAEVAERLFLSERTVAHHVSAVLRKLGETSRGRAVAAARRDGIVPTT